MKTSSIYRQTIDWLLEGDPAIQWQVKRDLLDAPSNDWKAIRRQVANTGWGRKLLDRQDTDYKWGKGLYSPKWISTHYTLMLLRRIGLPPDNNKARNACKLLIDKGVYQDGGINFWRSFKHSETCVSGMLLSLWAYFKVQDERIDKLLSFLLDQQMDDGGWNCRSFYGAKHSSLHTTISVLEGLFEYEKRYPDQCFDCRESVTRAHEFVLRHKLYKSDKTGEIIKPQFTRITFPPRWYYDVLRALDYFQEYNAEKDNRFHDAIVLLRSKRKDGKWPMQSLHRGKVFFVIEGSGEPSRWNTLRALRVLKWWNNKI